MGHLNYRKQSCCSLSRKMALPRLGSTTGSWIHSRITDWIHASSWSMTSWRAAWHRMPQTCPLRVRQREWQRYSIGDFVDCECAANQSWYKAPNEWCNSFCKHRWSPSCQPARPDWPHLQHKQPVLMQLMDMWPCVVLSMSHQKWSWRLTVPVTSTHEQPC